MERDRVTGVSRKNIFNFNSHAHVERDILVKDYQGNYADFNSHAHVERDGMSLAKTAEDLTFQLTRSRGAWPFDGKEWNTEKNFNSHAHVERDLAWFATLIHGLHFNSHAHVERDWICNYIIRIFLISTHTLTWSVTKYNSWNFPWVEFQLTRSRGAWLSS